MPGKDELGRLPQLGVYQLAVLKGAFAGLGLTEPGGASLVQVGGSLKNPKEQEHGPLGGDPDPEWAGRLVLETAEGMSGARFSATRNDRCGRCPVRSSCPAHDEGRRL